MSSKLPVSLTVNGKAYERLVEARMTLADFLRNELDLTGTHLGCEHGVCGACTILLNGEAVRSCLLLAVQADGADLSTVEGLAQGNQLQTAYAFLKETPTPTEAEVREAISGNICRCTGYQSIVEAVIQAAGNFKDVSKKRSSTP
jgi:carbon-monoxide dehydrogenase small subunit